MKTSQELPIRTEANRFVESVANIGIIAQGLGYLARWYTSESTILGRSEGMNSGFTANTVEVINHGELTPIQALVETYEKRQNISLSDEQKLDLYINTLIGFVIEALARALVKLPSFREKITPLARKAYDIADWKIVEEDDNKIVEEDDNSEEEQTPDIKQMNRGHFPRGMRWDPCDSRNEVVNSTRSDDFYWN